MLVLRFRLVYHICKYWIEFFYFLDHIDDNAVSANGKITASDIFEDDTEPCITNISISCD